MPELPQATLKTQPAPGMYVEALLADYRQRMNDLRRQRRYYGFVTKVCGAIVCAAVGWFSVSSAGEEPQAIVPIVVLLLEMAGLGLIFVYKTVELMRCYVMRLEYRLRLLLPAEHRVYCDKLITSNGAGQEGQAEEAVRIPFGFEIWRRARGAPLPDWARSPWLVGGLGLVIGLLAMASLSHGLQEPIYSKHGALRVAVLLASGSLPPVGGVIFASVLRQVAAWTRQVQQKVNERDPAELGLDAASARAAIMATDMEERSNDFRETSDLYPTLILAAASVVAGTLGVHIEGGPTHGWILLTLPPALLSLCLALNYTYRKNRQIKLYVGCVEQALDKVCAQVENGRGPVHWEQEPAGPPPGRKGFSIGFFSIVREKHVARAADLRVPWGMAVILVCAAVVGFLVSLWCVWRGHEWIGARWPQMAWTMMTVYLVGIVILLAVNAHLYMTSGRACSVRG